MKIKSTRNILIASTLMHLTLCSVSKATSLSLGADYTLRGVSITERDKTVKGTDYYDQRLQAYLITDLSQDVEATIRIQSITPWGLETSSTPLVTRYPHSNGNLWVQNAFVRLPKVWKDHLTLTMGRQPLQWGDGTILADDDLGLNAIRAQLKSPWKKVRFDIDAFTAKISEGLRNSADKDVHGVLVGTDHNAVRWELMGLWEKGKGQENYEMGAETSPVVSSKLDRLIYGVRAKANLKDAYVKGEYYVQSGSLQRAPLSKDIKFGGDAYVVGLGGKQNTDKFGRFGALIEVASGSGDDPNTPEKDESIRPLLASRWSGLERKGYGRYFAATLSDAYSPSDSFGPATSENDGLPEGLSGIQSIRFGLESTPWSQWTFSFDYYQYKAQKALVGKKELGTEFDYGFVYRYSGLVNVRGSTNIFNPGEAFDEATRQKANWSSLEVEIKF